MLKAHIPVEASIGVEMMPLFRNGYRARISAYDTQTDALPGTIALKMAIWIRLHR
jgi:hypothetical protein